MNRYAILNSRKRAIVALVHSIAFGLLACYQFLIGQRPVPLLTATRAHFAGPLAMSVIYFLVTVALVTLVAYSRASIERIYFSFCATSAGIGMVRVVFGDPTLHFGSFSRVLLLGCAAITGTLIAREHSSRLPQLAQ